MLCFTSSDKLPDIQKTIFGFPTDKVAHFLMFLPFPILFYMAWDHDTSKALRSIGFNLLNLSCGILVAALTEWVQKYLPTRSMDLHDFNTDLIALAIGTAFVFLVDITHLKSRRN